MAPPTTDTLAALLAHAVAQRSPRRLGRALLQRVLLVNEAPLSSSRLQTLLDVWEHPAAQFLAHDPAKFWGLSAHEWLRVKAQWSKHVSEGQPDLRSGLTAIDEPRLVPSLVYSKTRLDAQRISDIKQLLSLLKAKDPRLQTLIDDDVNRWAFASEGELLAAIGKWDSNGPRVPESLAGHRRPTMPQTIRHNWPPDRRPTAETYHTQEAQFSTSWGACGVTGMSLLGRLHDLGAQVELVQRRTFRGREGAEALAGLITDDVASVTILNIQDPKIHEFTIEKQPKKGAVLHQGYIGAYTALWFAGLQELSDAQLMQSINVVTSGIEGSGEHSAKGATIRPPVEERLMALKNDLAKIRDDYGRGQQLRGDKLNSFASRLAGFVAAGTTDTANAAAHWKSLPFQPAKDIRELPKTSIEFLVEVWIVRRPEKVSAQDWLTNAVLLEAASWWKDIAKFKAAEPEREVKKPKAAVLIPTPAAKTGKADATTPIAKQTTPPTDVTPPMAKLTTAERTAAVAPLKSDLDGRWKQMAKAIPASRSAEWGFESSYETWLRARGRPDIEEWAERYLDWLQATLASAADHLDSRWRDIISVLTDLRSTEAIVRARNRASEWRSGWSRLYDGFKKGDLCDGQALVDEPARFLDELVANHKGKPSAQWSEEALRWGRRKGSHWT